MSKGANTPLPSTVVRALVEWRAAPGTPAVDVAAMLLSAAGTVTSHADVVFRDRPEHTSGAVRHAGTAVVLDLARVPQNVARVIVTGLSVGGPFGAVPGLAFSVADEQAGPLARFELPAATTETAIVFGEFYRRDGGWRLRAVGQGYDTGMAGLGGDVGLDRAAPAPPTAPARPASPPATPPPPSPVPPPPPPAVRLTKGEERLPVDMRKRLELRKQQVAVSLEKAGGTGLTARVILVLDASGSMSNLYAKGVVAASVERMVAVAAQLDDDGTMQAWTFATHAARLPDLELGDLPAWLDLHVRVGGVFRQRNLRDGQIDMGGIGIGNDEPKVIAQVREFVATHPQREPTLVLFFSDGGVYKNRQIEEQLRAAVEEPVFWQFIGLGKGKFGVLEKFDELPGRRVDNVGFFSVRDITAVSDEDLYGMLLHEFPAYVRAARAAGIEPA